MSLLLLLVVLAMMCASSPLAALADDLGVGGDSTHQVAPEGSVGEAQSEAGDAGEKREAPAEPSDGPSTADGVSPKEPRAGETSAEEGEAERMRLEPAAALMAGVEAGEAGRWGEAIALVEQALEASPTWSVAHLEMAHALLMSGGDPEEIGQHLQQARLLGRDSARMHYLEGLLMEERRQPAMAASAYEQAVQIRPSLLDARVRLGRILLAEGHVDDAIEHLEAAVEIDPVFLPGRANLAQAYEAAGRVDDAAVQLGAMATMHPDNPFHLRRLAELYERHGREREAMEASKKADEAAREPPPPRMRPLLPSRR